VEYEGIAFEIEAMRPTSSVPNRLLAAAVVFASLPGPTRKRAPSAYCYRLTYRNPNPTEPGCVLLWDVDGGRQSYQIALERESAGTLRWHCTCADAVYRGEDAPHLCKHVRGLQALGRQPITNSVPSTPCSGAA
jgi:hypothetical protein